jgi:hypothetical protein
MALRRKDFLIYSVVQVLGRSGVRRRRTQEVVQRLGVHWLVGRRLLAVHNVE